MLWKIYTLLIVLQYYNKTLWIQICGQPNWALNYQFAIPKYRLRTVNEFYPTTHLCHHQWKDIFIRLGIQEDSKALYRLKRTGNQLVMSAVAVRRVTLLHAPTLPPGLSFECTWKFLKKDSMKQQFFSSKLRLTKAEWSPADNSAFFL